MTAPRVTFAEQFYYPDGWGGAQLPRDITMALARAGWRVDVICGSDPYAPVLGDSQPDPSVVGVRIRRVPRLLPGDIHTFKLARQLWYYAACIPLLLASRCSVYVAQTNPPLIVPITAVVAWLRRRPLVIVAQDVYPEVLFAHGMMNSERLVACMLRSIFRWGYRRANWVVSLGPVMSARLMAKGVAAARIVQISNWATGDETVVRGQQNRLRQQWGLDDKFVLLYSGNLGVAHDVETPIAAVAKALVLVPNLVLVFVGKGSRLSEAREMVATLGIEHAVQFRPFVPFELLPHSLGLADLGLVTLREGFEGLVVPSKLFGHLARGVPTLYVGPQSDIEFYITEAQAGCCISNGDVQGLADRLVALAGEPSRLDEMRDAATRYYEQHLAKPIGLARYMALLGDLVGFGNPMLKLKR